MGQGHLPRTCGMCSHGPVGQMIPSGTGKESLFLLTEQLHDWPPPTSEGSEEFIKKGQYVPLTHHGPRSLPAVWQQEVGKTFDEVKLLHSDVTYSQCGRKYVSVPAACHQGANYNDYSVHGLYLIVDVNSPNLSTPANGCVQPWVAMVTSTCIDILVVELQHTLGEKSLSWRR